jgi:fructose/tagatose bisphosphate aldolase
VNVNTELREAYLAATRGMLEDVEEGRRVTSLHDAQAAAVQRVAEQKLAALQGTGGE